MKHRLVMNPAGIQQFRTLRQHRVCFGRVFNDGVNKLTNVFVRKTAHARQLYSAGLGFVH